MTSALARKVSGHRGRAPAWGLAAAVVLLVLAGVVPPATGWGVHARSFPPLHAQWLPRVGPGTLPAVAAAVVGVLWAGQAARRLPWPVLLAVTWLAGMTWMLSLALVDGLDGVGRILDTRPESLQTARATTDVSATLHEYVSRIPFSHPHNWPVHVAGHPPGALLFFVLLVRLGLGSGLGAGLVVTALAATTPLAVLVTLRALSQEREARLALPFLVLGPAAIWQSVSADAMFAAVAAWGTATLALGAVRRSAGWSLLAGVLLGYCVMLSYGLPLLAVLALAVLAAARSWFPLPFAAAAALGVVLAFAATGFAWWEALPVLRERYWAGVASDRPTAYWLWGDLAALLFSAGPLLGASLAASGRELARALMRPARHRVGALVAAAVAMVLLADASLMSKAGVERIWLPFVPLLLLSCAFLPARWARAGLVLQVGFALVVQHLLWSDW
jgi:hypothetical protein